MTVSAAGASVDKAPIAEVSNLVAVHGLTARALMEMTFEPISYVVPGFLAEGLTVFAGAPKIGKSWLAMGLALAVATGGLAFGKVPCEPGAVLYLALEDNPRRLQRRLRHMSVEISSDNLTFVTDWPDLNEGCVAQLERWLDVSPEAKLIVIDVLAKVKGGIRGDKPQYDLDYMSASGLQSLAGKYGIAIVAVHHTRKMDADDPFDAVSGTRGLTGAADTVWVLKRENGAQQPTLYGRGRDIEEFETAMRFNGNTGSWTIIGAAAEVAKTSERQAILDELCRAGLAMTASELAAALGKRRDGVQHLLGRMLREGKVTKQGRGRYVPVTLLTPFTFDGVGDRGGGRQTFDRHEARLSE